MPTVIPALPSRTSVIVTPWVADGLFERISNSVDRANDGDPKMDSKSIQGDVLFWSFVAVRSTWLFHCV